MSAIQPLKQTIGNGYPTTDHKPMAETDLHRDLMAELIETLKLFFQELARVYVSGNLLVFYERGNRRRHVSPDVFVVRGVPKHRRENYLIWEERKAPEIVIELTSSTTRNEDIRTKFNLYRDTLRVKEYFLFDPRGDHLSPRLQGYRLRQGEYRPIRLLNGRMPSRVLGLHLESAGQILRLFDPMTGEWVPTPSERVEQADESRDQADQAREQADQAREQADQAREQADQAREQADQARELADQARENAEQALKQLQRENEELRRRLDEK